MMLVYVTDAITILRVHVLRAIRYLKLFEIISFSKSSNCLIMLIMFNYTKFYF